MLSIFQHFHAIPLRSPLISLRSKWRLTGFSRRFTPKNPVRLHNPFGELPRWGAKNVLPLNLIAFPRGEGCDTRIPSSKKRRRSRHLNLEPNESKVKMGCEEMRIHFFTAHFLCGSVLRTNDNVSVRCFAFGIGGDGVVVLQSQMDDAAFTGSHRFEADLFARAFHLAC